MKEFRITWSIDIDAETPEDAALEAILIQRDPESTATVFFAQEIGPDFPERVTVDVGPAADKAESTWIRGVDDVI